MRTRRTILAICAFLLTALATPSAQAQDALQQIDQAVAQWVDSREAAPSALRFQARAVEDSEDNLTAADAVCFPTCDETDARMLSIAGEDLQTLARDAIQLRVAVAAGETSFQVGFFDGDSSGTWDLVGPVAVPLLYQLIADPQGDGTGVLIVDQWLGSSLPDNAWADFTVNTGPEAQSPSGAYFYRLQITSTNPDVINNWSNFKVRTSGSLATSAAVNPIAFGFTAPLFGPREGPIVYPNAGVGDFTTTTYDGNWTFYVDVFQTSNEFVVWDGDFDRGSFNNTDLDTDDPDTPGAPFLPPWAIGTAARPEGVAFVLFCNTEASATGCPADDRSTPVFRRSPSVQHALTLPTGEVLANPNPSGNREWEQFRVSTDPFDRSQMDYHVDDLTSGIYRVDLQGVDMSNLNAWRFFNGVLGVCDDGTPCRPFPRPYLIGDTVYLDSDGDATQDPGEPGIAGVVVNLLDSNGAILATTTTDANGEYVFNVDRGTFTVELDPSNFAPGGALDGGTVTTAGDNGGTQQTRTILLTNDYTYDFGVRGTGSIGDRVWNDLNGNGVQDPGEPGLNSVTVTLTGAGPDGFFGTADDVSYGSQVTSGDGDYDFTGLLAGSYRVDVVDATVPPGFVSTTGNDPLVVNLAGGEDFNDADFGYGQVGSIGDRVWFDADGDGVQDTGETGINGVTVILYDAAGNEVARTTTSGDGNYSFGGLFAGEYTVVIDTDTLPDGYQPTYDADGLVTPNQATVTLAAGQDRTDVDFGYDQCGECKGKVSRLTLRYDGDAPAEITVVGKRGPRRDVLYTGIVAPGDTFEVVGPASGNGGFSGTLGTNIVLFVDGVESTSIHTSCSVPIGPGVISGDFTVVAGASKEGGPLCPIGDECVDCNGDGGDDDGEQTGTGTGTLGYWKNHPEAWPTNKVVVGGYTFTKKEALHYLNQSVEGWAALQLFHQLVPAKLNVMIGNDDSCVADTIYWSDVWFYYYFTGQNPSDDDARALAGVLDMYNNGRLCAPHR